MVRNNYVCTIRLPISHQQTIHTNLSTNIFGVCVCICVCASHHPSSIIFTSQEEHRRRKTLYSSQNQHSRESRTTRQTSKIEKKKMRATTKRLGVSLQTTLQNQKNVTKPFIRSFSNDGSTPTTTSYESMEKDARYRPVNEYVLFFCRFQIDTLTSLPIRSTFTQQHIFYTIKL